MTDFNPSISDSPLPPKSVEQRAGRFALWELFVLTTLVCLAGGFFAWWREYPEALLFLAVNVFAAIAFGIHVFTRWSVLTSSGATVVLALFGSLFLPANRGSREAFRRMQCSNHLKQIGLALQNYHDAYGSFPPAYIADASGKPIHGWRVLILPFIEQKPLYDKYSFNEPWDGPNNRKLHSEVVHVYQCPSRPGRQARGETSYVAVVGSKTMWPGSKATALKDNIDGTGNTIMVVEVANSGIHWMAPRELDLTTLPLAVNGKTGPGISSVHPNVALAVFADGHTAAISKGTPATIIQGLLTIAGQETIGDY